LVCAANIKGIGTSCKIYANDNRESWPVPGFSKNGIGVSGKQVMYTPNDAFGRVDGVGDQGNLTRRQFQTQSDSLPGRTDGSTIMSVTRSFWMLVRSGDTTVKQFICPSSGDKPDPTEEIDRYYDFEAYENVSYGYLVPFGPLDTVAREGSDNRLAMAADKGPFYIRKTKPAEHNPNRGITPDSSPREWRFNNSPNHGGLGSGEGQNVLFADGHATFEKMPVVGIDQDNIYTVMTNFAYDDGRWYGVIPRAFNGFNRGPFPGQQTFGPGPGEHASTDSLIYP
jgi:prepilin-type processing-associated H-X9-DG protein